MRQAPTEPMTLGNMRSLGVRGLAVHCGGHDCWHSAVLDVDAYPDEVPVPAFVPRLRCKKCGHRGADARPNWVERHLDHELRPNLRQGAAQRRTGLQAT